MTEAELTRSLVKRLNEKRGIYCYRNHGGPYAKIGVSDITGVAGGHFFAVEVKKPGKEDTITQNQERFLDHVRDAGGRAGMATNFKEALRIVNGY